VTPVGRGRNPCAQARRTLPPRHSGPRGGVAPKLSFRAPRSPRPRASHAAPALLDSCRPLGTNAVTDVVHDTAGTPLELHYLGYRPLCGAQARYLIRCRDSDIGALGFSAPAYRLKARDRWIGWSESAKKESIKWLKSFEAAARLQRQLGERTTVVSVGDREADVYELFVLALGDPAHPRLLVRAEQDRLLEDGQEHLWEHIEGQPVAGRYLLEVPRRKGRRARQAMMEVRHAEMELKPPKRKAHLGSIRVWAVLAREIDPPSEKDAVEWMLLTTVPVGDFTQAREKVEWYKKRWSIEEYHRTIKSGCRIEDRQLEDRTNWEKCLAVDLVVAWRIEHIKKLSRQKPQESPLRSLTKPTRSRLCVPTCSGRRNRACPASVRLDVGGNQHRVNALELAEAALVEPLAEESDGSGVRGARVFVPNVRGEEFQEAPRRALAGAPDERRHGRDVVRRKPLRLVNDGDSPRFGHKVLGGHGRRLQGRRWRVAWRAVTVSRTVRAA